VTRQDVLYYRRECPGTSQKEAMELIERKREIEDTVAKKRRAVDRCSEEKAAAAALDGPTVDQPPQRRSAANHTARDGMGIGRCRDPQSVLINTMEPADGARIAGFGP
jgi:hypothetical protein